MYLDINQLTETFSGKTLSSKSLSSTDHMYVRRGTIPCTNLLVSLIRLKTYKTFYKIKTYFLSVIYANYLYGVSISNQKEPVRSVYKPSFARLLQVSTHEQPQKQLSNLPTSPATHSEAPNSFPLYSVPSSRIKLA